MQPPDETGPRVIVLNGVSSAGKSTIARHLQALLPRPHLVLGVDTLVDAMPPGLLDQHDGLVLRDDGRVDVGAAFTAIEDAWYAGLAATARAGAHLLLDEVLLGGARSQRRLSTALEGLTVRWVAVHYDLGVAAAREAARSDRKPGMAVGQAPLVHAGVRYDLEVDTTSLSAAVCAQQIVAALAPRSDLSAGR